MCGSSHDLITFELMKLWPLKRRLYPFSQPDCRFGQLSASTKTESVLLQIATWTVFSKPNLCRQKEENICKSPNVINQIYTKQKYTIYSTSIQTDLQDVEMILHVISCLCFRCWCIMIHLPHAIASGIQGTWLGCDLFLWFLVMRGPCKILQTSHRACDHAGGLVLKWVAQDR